MGRRKRIDNLFLENVEKGNYNEAIDSLLEITADKVVKSLHEEIDEYDKAVSTYLKVYNSLLKRQSMNNTFDDDEEDEISVNDIANDILGA